jgi:hypothetical protein
MRTVTTLALLALALAACGRSPRLETRTFPLKHIEPGTAHGLIEPYVFGDREGAPGTMSLTENTVTVRETPDNLEKIARVLAEFDLPSPWVRLHFQLIEADGAGAADPRIADLEAELRQLFRYGGYRLAAEAVVTGTARSTIEQSIGGDVRRGEGYALTVNIGEVRVIGESGYVALNVNLRSPFGSGGLGTRVNARTGQTLVIGNAQLTQGSGTMILAVRPELADGR